MNRRRLLRVWSDPRARPTRACKAMQREPVDKPVLHGHSPMVSIAVRAATNSLAGALAAPLGSVARSGGSLAVCGTARATSRSGPIAHGGRTAGTTRKRASAAGSRFTARPPRLGQAMTVRRHSALPPAASEVGRMDRHRRAVPCVHGATIVARTRHVPRSSPPGHADSWD